MSRTGVALVTLAFTIPARSSSAEDGGVAVDAAVGVSVEASVDASVGDPAVDEPVVEDPAVEDPVVEDPVVDDPIVTDAVVEYPVVEDTAVASASVEASLDPTLDGERYPDCASRGGVVGHRRCPPYGIWGAALEAPYAAVSVGINMRRLLRAPAPKPMTAARSTEPPPSAALGGADTSYTVLERLDIATNSLMYVGFEFEISPTADETPAPGACTFAAGSQALFGLRGGFRRLKLGGEIAAGDRMVEVAFVDADDEFVLEARVRGQLWLTPWVTIGGLYGTSLLDRGEWLAGIQLGVHTYSWGGP